VYTRCLADALCELGHEVRLIADCPICAEGSGAGVVTMPWRFGPIKFRALWERLLLPAASLRMGLDCLHFPAGQVAHSPKTCPQVATIHDLYAFAIPEVYPPHQAASQRRDLIATAARCDALIADSECTKNDMMRFLGLPPEAITVIPLAPRECFHKIREIEKPTDVRAALGLPERYFLCVGGKNNRFHKNTRRVVEAVGRLNEPLRSQVGIVIVGRESEYLDTVRGRADELGLRDQVMFTGIIDDEKLRLLYNLAAAFVFPSLYEGFGLPILEAMACGTPVITGNRGAMMEVAGDAAVLVDPDDPEEISDAMAHLLTDEVARDDFSSRGLARAGLFTWRKTAEITAEVYAMVSSRPRSRSRGEVRRS